MNQITFDIAKRTDGEKNKSLRKNGQIPCIIYGEYLENSIPAKISSKNLTQLVRNNSKGAIIKLKCEGQTKNCVVKDIQWDPVTRDFLHADFQAVNPNEVIKMKIPVDFFGMDNLQLRRLVLNTTLSDLEMQGQVEKIPEHIRIDVKSMNYEDKIFAKDINLPDGVRLITDPETLVAVITGSNPSSNDDSTEEEEISLV